MRSSSSLKMERNRKARKGSPWLQDLMPGTTTPRSGLKLGAKIQMQVLWWSVQMRFKDKWYKLSNYIKMAPMVMFGDEIGEKLWATVNTAFRELFEEYRNIYAPTDKVQPPNDSQEPAEASKSKRLMRSIIDQEMSRNGGRNVTVKSELEKYFSEDNEDDKKGFDILKWWKDNANRFPVLSRMARDLLAVPISTVASESAFSAGGRVLDDFRSSLTPQMVERLICANDWIRGSEYISVEENTEELAKLEEELFGMTISSKEKESTPES